jgi:hypothetical protein
MEEPEAARNEVRRIWWPDDGWNLLFARKCYYIARTG